MTENIPMVADILAGKAKKKLLVSERPSVAVAFALANALAATLIEREKSETFHQESENAMSYARKNMPPEVRVVLVERMLPFIRISKSPEFRKVIDGIMDCFVE